MPTSPSVSNRMSTDQPRIGLAFPGNTRDPSSWSGIPSALSDALESLGAALSPIRAQPHPLIVGTIVNGLSLGLVLRHPLADPTVALRSARRHARAMPSVAAIQGWAATRHMRRSTGLRAVLQLQSGYMIGGDTPVITYDDMTVVQALTHGYAEFQGMPERSRRHRVAVQRAVFLRAFACCATSAWARDSIINDYGLAPERVHVVGIGSNRQCAEVRRDWSPPRFLFVGKDWQRKNGDAVVRAFSRLRDRVPLAELHLVGDHPRVDQEGAVGHGPLRLQVADERRRVDNLFRAATCFVLPSHCEPTAISYVEAATFGLPSVGTTVGGSAELIGDGGVTIDPGDEEALLAAMTRLSDPAEASRLGAAARGRSQSITWKAVAARILSVLPDRPARESA